MSQKTQWIIVVLIFIIITGAFYFMRTTAPIVPRAVETPMKNVEMLQSEKGQRVTAGPIEYMPNVHGFLAEPSVKGRYPGVVIVHEWWGLNDNIREMAKQLAGEGYMVLAVDLFGSVASTSQEAQRQVGALDQQKATANLRAGVAFLRARGATTMAGLGWCFGGGQSLQLALSGETLDATVIYYGSLVTDTKKLKAINWPVLGIFGEKDQSITPQMVAKFDAALSELRVDHEIHEYPGVGHAFANPSGMNYAPEATKDAWQKTLAFLARTLKENGTAATSVTPPQAVTIRYTDSGFMPQSIVVAKGTAVTFVNTGTHWVWPASGRHPTHTLYPTTGGCIGSTFDSCRGLNPGESWTFIFDAPGSWKYHNHLVPEEAGTVAVQ